MKKLFLALNCILFSLLVSCGGGNNSENTATEDKDARLIPEERRALAYVKTHLDNGDTLTDYEVCKGPMPVELMTEVYKGYRDEVNKAGLDYNSCKTRNIPSGMEKAEKKIAEIQNELQTKVSEWQVSQGTSEYVFVLMTLTTKGNTVKKEIAAFNPATGQHDFTLPLTNSMVNNASMIVAGVNGSLFNYATDPNFDISTIIPKDNPMLGFIFNANPKEVR